MRARGPRVAVHMFGASRSTVKPLVFDHLLQQLARVLGFELLCLAAGLTLEIVVTTSRLAPPFAKVKLAASFSRSHRRAIDGGLESMGKFYLGDLTPTLGNHLGGNIPPEYRDQLGHERCTASVSLTAGLAVLTVYFAQALCLRFINS